MLRKSLIILPALLLLLSTVPLAASQNKVRRINEQGNQLYTGEQWADALAEYTAAGELDPQNPVLHYNLGNVHFRLNDLDKAETHYRVAAAAEDEQLARRARFNLGNTEFRRAEALEGAGDWQGRNQALGKSIEHWRSVLEGDPGNRDAKLNLELARRKLLEEPPENQQQQQDQQNQDQEEDQQDQQDQQQQQDQQNQDQQQEEQEDQQQQQDQQDQEEQEGEEQQQQQQEDGGEEQEQEQQQQQSAEEQQQEQEQQAAEQQAQEMRISPEEAERILDALRDEELEEQKRQAAERKGRRGSAAKDW
jgi:hypothetical protein